MANTGVVSFTSTIPGEFPAIKPDVYINGKIRPEYTCLSIEHSAGIVPSKCTLQWNPQVLKSVQEDYSPITLDVFGYETGE